MTPAPPTAGAVKVVLVARTAEDLMATNPVSIHECKTVHEAASVLTDRGIGALPVINNAGRPVGVVSRSDIVRYESDTSKHARHVAAGTDEDELALGTGEVLEGFQVEETDLTPVKDIMTPTVLSVSLHEPALDVVVKMAAMKVHRLFVVDNGGTLVGVVSALDVLRKLRAEV